MKVLCGGLPGNLQLALMQAFPDLTIERCVSGRGTLNNLLDSSWDLVLLNHGLKGPDAVRILDYLKDHPHLRSTRVLYLLSEKVPEGLPDKLVDGYGVHTLLFPPVEMRYFCRHVALALDLPDTETLPRDTWDSTHTRSDRRGALIWLASECQDLCATLVAEGRNRGWRVAVQDEPPESEAAVLVFDARQGAETPELPERSLFLIPEGLEPRLQAAEKGASRLLTYPWENTLLFEVIDALFHAGEENELRILAAGPRPATLGRAQWSLTKAGFRVQTTTDLDRIFETLESFLPDLLILDNPPDARLCAAVRCDQRYHDLPLVVVAPEATADFFSAGVDDVIRSDQSDTALVGRVQNRLSRTRTSRQSERDPLTGCLTRRRAISVLGRFMRLARRRNSKLVVALVDLDHFKKINDSWGHPVGDQVLTRTGQLLRHTFRNEDVVARWGGEEFLLGLYGISLARAVARLNKCLKRLKTSHFETPSGRFEVTFSAGLAALEDNSASLVDLIQAADKALYQAKEQGRARICEASAETVNS